MSAPYRPAMIAGKRVASSEYRSWQMMKERAKDATKHGYKHYISMEAAWESFDTFIADMGSKPSPEHTLERVDGGVGYGPNNCIWATRTRQARNRTYVKLSMDKAREIRRLYALGLRQVDLAEAFSVSQALISQVIRSCVWIEEGAK